MSIEEDIPHEQIIGFDLGHGDSAIAVALTRSEGESGLEQKEFFGNHRVNPTALRGRAGECKDGKWLFGFPAIHAAVSLPRFFVGIKVRPSSPEWPEKGPLLQCFAKAVLDELKPRLDPRLGVLYYIGCPSDWDEKLDVERYRNALHEASGAAWEVIPESRAAMIYARDVAHIPVRQLKASVLVIDIGSSTTDLTLVRGADPQPFDVGSDLGGGLIDRMLLHLLLSHDPNRVPIRDFLVQNRGLWYWLLFKCRIKKEEYFNNCVGEAVPQQRPPAGTNAVYSELVEIKEGLTFRLAIDGSLMWDALNTPLQALEDPIRQSDGDALLMARHGLGELSRHTWLTAYEQILRRAKPQFQEAGVEKILLLFTGGASRMPFTRDKAEEVFREDPAVSFEVAPSREPEYSVCRGLALYGRWRWRVDRFKEAVGAIADRPEIAHLIEKHLESFNTAVVMVLSPLAYERVTIPMVRKWGAGELEIRRDEQGETYVVEKKERGDGWKTYSMSLFDTIDKKTKEMWALPEVQAAFAVELKNRCRGFIEDLKKLTDPVCDRFGVDRDSMVLALDVPTVRTRSWVETSVESLAEFVARALQNLPVPLRKPIAWAMEIPLSMHSAAIRNEGFALQQELMDYPSTQAWKDAMVESVRTQIAAKLRARVEEKGLVIQIRS